MGELIHLRPPAPQSLDAHRCVTQPCEHTGPADGSRRPQEPEGVLPSPSVDPGGAGNPLREFAFAYAELMLSVPDDCRDGLTLKACKFAEAFAVMNTTLGGAA